MITFEYSDNSEAVAKSLGNFQAALSDQQSPLQQVADDFREMVREQFASEGRAEGTPWAPRVGAGLAPPSRRVMQTSPLLVRTGALRDSLARKGAAGSLDEQTDQSLTLGSRLPYAIFHQLGTRRMPARPLFVLNDARAAKWTEFVRKAMEGKTALLGPSELGAQGGKG